MELNMGYHSITQFYKTLRFDWLCLIAPVHAIARVDELHKPCCDRSTAYVLQYNSSSIDQTIM